MDIGNLGLYVSPVLVSLNKATYKPSLTEQATQNYIQTLERLFTNNLITSWKVGGRYSGLSRDGKDYFMINSNFLEVAGMYLPQITDYGKRLDVNHSTFIRNDVDFRYFLRINENHELAFRTFGGIGVPIGNQSVLPYERRFFAGGSNYLRGWRIRTLGPGSFTADNDLQFTRTGELSMMGNMEYRFNVIRGAVDLNASIFADVGNVWNLKSDTLFPGGEFDINAILYGVCLQQWGRSTT